MSKKSRRALMQETSCLNNDYFFLNLMDHVIERPMGSKKKLNIMNSKDRNTPKPLKKEKAKWKRI